MFKKKTWVEVARKFTPPTTTPFKMKFGSQDTIIRLVEGVTIIEMRCNETGELKFYTEYGDQT